MKIAIETTDGTVYEAEASDRTWMCAADRFKFERYFQVSTVALQVWQQLTSSDDEDEEAVVDVASLSDEALRLLREEHMLFFVHRELHRQVDGGLPPFDEILDDVVSYKLGDDDEGGGADPSQAPEEPGGS